MLMFCLSVIESEAKKCAFEDMYIRNASMMRRAVSRYYGGSRSDREDILQNTWMFVAERMEALHFPGEKAERAYLLTVLRNRTWEYARRRKNIHRHEIPLLDMEEWWNGEQETPERVVCSKTDEEALRAAVRRLPPSEREVLTLHLYVELSFADIAQALNISEKAARGRFERAQARLIKQMKEEGVLNESV